MDIADLRERDSLTSSAARARSVVLLGVAAIVLSITGVFWIPVLLGSLNFITPGQQAAARFRQEIDRHDQRLIVLERQTGAVTDGTARMQADTERTLRQRQQLDTTISAMALTDLGAALRGRGGFSGQLVVARVVLVPEVAGLVDRIAPYAETGIPDVLQLRAGFTRTRAELGRQSADSTALGWMRSLMGRDGLSDETDAAMNVIARHLQADDLRGAVVAAERTPAPYPLPVAEWLDDARARIAADDLIGLIDALAAQRGRAGRQ